ncbi:hypothetical protein [Stutzerimonas xanthomarina]|uniref:Uncharacterized protein n=2 Tax=Stutzerimonas xanthomarina TaxID=271420 RepID=A0A1M5TKN1_9GAMM|nr:hypothetical protein [Stutzerimonas xanthomarina]MCP9339976.1 hypothetical protein [Stutzerimonas xanthomarina]SEH55686.1 hypothetical protein SAMN05216535_0493 [Stutzerimonas xanthomarina]SHH51220.1 hypothetical protein SAMN02744645_3955 [Stutzerimonas xanthomarina DSM 18231]
MNQSERGKENLETINDRNDERVDQAGRSTNGEAAGGDRDDVPGGAYNVPRGMADEVSDEDALKRNKQHRPER